MAHPTNFIFAKKYLDQDAHYYKAHVVDSGPLGYKNYGAHISSWSAIPSMGKKASPTWTVSGIASSKTSRRKPRRCALDALM
jgi:hypothetical protein